MALSESGIEYLDYVWEFYPGCRHWEIGLCAVGRKCWALRQVVHWRKGDFTPHFRPDKLLDPLRRKKPARIGVCFTGDLFGDWVPFDQEIGVENAHEIWAHPCRDTSYKPFIKYSTTLKDIVFMICEKCPQHTFIFLTKRPQNMIKWGRFPDNAWVGVSATNKEQASAACVRLSQVSAKVKFISLEPLSSWDDVDFVTRFEDQKNNNDIDWLVIGGWSGGVHPPYVEWIREAVEVADRAGIPVFLKDNLNTVVDNWQGFHQQVKSGNYSGSWKLRQEFPEVN